MLQPMCRKEAPASRVTCIAETLLSKCWRGDIFRSCKRVAKKAYKASRFRAASRFFGGRLRKRWIRFRSLADSRRPSPSGESPQISTSSVTPYSFRRTIKEGMSGRLTSVSQFDTVAFVNPTSSATCSWVNLACVRNAFRRVPRLFIWTVWRSAQQLSYKII